MDKSNVVLILKECFKQKRNCAVIHFSDGTNLFINNKPSFADLLMVCEVTEYYGDKQTREQYYIPYSSIMYITTTNSENLNIIQEYNIEMNKFIMSEEDCV